MVSNNKLLGDIELDKIIVNLKKNFCRSVKI